MRTWMVGRAWNQLSLFIIFYHCLSSRPQTLVGAASKVHLQRRHLRKESERRLWCIWHSQEISIKTQQLTFGKSNASSLARILGIIMIVICGKQDMRRHTVQLWNDIMLLSTSLSLSVWLARSFIRWWAGCLSCCLVRRSSSLVVVLWLYDHCCLSYAWQSVPHHSP